jgi:hypothetical protein
MEMQRYYDYEQKHRRRTMSKIEYCKQHIYTPHKDCVYCEGDKLAEELEALQQQVDKLKQDALEDAEWAEACDVRNDTLQQQVEGLQQQVDEHEADRELISKVAAQLRVDIAAGRKPKLALAAQEKGDDN